MHIQVMYSITCDAREESRMGQTGLLGCAAADQLMTQLASPLGCSLHDPTQAGRRQSECLGHGDQLWVIRANTGAEGALATPKKSKAIRGFPKPPFALSGVAGPHRVSTL